jgi:nucleotide-binding universal stress UspA family protein
MNGEVVVGVAGTPSSQDAVRWGADAAQARGVELVLVHAVGLPVAGYEGVWDDALNAGVSAMLAREAEVAGEAYPDLKVRTEVDMETPGRALTRRSGEASVLVVGTRRTTPQHRVYSGSLAYQVVAGARCPVVVVPPSVRVPENRVVVGADGSSEGLEAVRVAAREADRTGAVLQVVHAWREPTILASVGWVPPELPSAVKDEERVVLGESTAGLAEEYPDLEVERTLAEADPSSALLAAAALARLLVVGSHGRGGVARMLLGSVSHAMVLHSPCPVLVVRGNRKEKDDEH